MTAIFNVGAEGGGGFVVGALGTGRRARHRGWRGPFQMVCWHPPSYGMPLVHALVSRG